MLLFFLACSGSTEPTPAPVTEEAAVEQPAAAKRPAAEQIEAENATAAEPAAEEAEPEGVEAEAELEPAAEEAEPEGIEAEAEPEGAEPAAEEAEPEGAEAELEGVEAEPAPLVATTHTLNSSASQLYVQVFKDPDTIGSGASHDHVIVAKGWSGTVTWHPTDASQCQIDITVPVKKLSVDPSAMRAAVGYDSTLSDSQRGSVKKNMLASDQLNSSRSYSVSSSGGGTSASACAS